MQDLWIDAIVRQKTGVSVGPFLEPIAALRICSHAEDHNLPRMSSAPNLSLALRKGGAFFSTSTCSGRVNRYSRALSQ